MQSLINKFFNKAPAVVLHTVFPVPQLAHITDFYLKDAAIPYKKGSKTVHLGSVPLASLPTLNKIDFSQKYCWTWLGQSIVSSVHSIHQDEIEEGLSFRLILNETPQDKLFLSSYIPLINNLKIPLLKSNTEEYQLEHSVSIECILEKYKAYSEIKERDMENIDVPPEWMALMAETGLVGAWDVSLAIQKYSELMGDGKEADLSIPNIYFAAPDPEMEASLVRSLIPSLPIPPALDPQEELRILFSNIHPSLNLANVRTGNLLADTLVQQSLIPPSQMKEYMRLIAGGLVSKRKDKVLENEARGLIRARAIVEQVENNEGEGIDLVLVSRMRSEMVRDELERNGFVRME